MQSKSSIVSLNYHLKMICLVVDYHLVVVKIEILVSLTGYVYDI